MVIIVEEANELFGSHEPQRLTNNGANFDPDWFDPTALDVAPSEVLLTTVWGKIKKD